MRLCTHFPHDDFAHGYKNIGRRHLRPPDSDARERCAILRRDNPRLHFIIKCVTSAINGKQSGPTRTVVGRDYLEFSWDIFCPIMSDGDLYKNMFFQIIHPDHRRILMCSVRPMVHRIGKRSTCDIVFTIFFRGCSG